MIIETERFGQLAVGDDEQILTPQGIPGFPDHRKFCFVDTGDETLILWLQSMHSPEVAFPLLEPKIFKPDYSVKLSQLELRELHLARIQDAAVFSILTIPQDLTRMTANLKAPLVLNLKERIAKQVILQENEWAIQHEMFRELKAHLITLSSQRQAESQRSSSVIGIESIPHSECLRLPKELSPGL